MGRQDALRLNGLKGVELSPNFIIVRSIAAVITQLELVFHWLVSDGVFLPPQALLFQERLHSPIKDVRVHQNGQ